MIPRPNAGLGSFVSRSFEIGKNIGQYYGILERSPMVSDEQKCKAHGDGIISATIQTFSEWVVIIADYVTDENGKI